MLMWRIARGSEQNVCCSHHTQRRGWKTVGVCKAKCYRHWLPKGISWIIVATAQKRALLLTPCDRAGFRDAPNPQEKPRFATDKARIAPLVVHVTARAKLTLRTRWGSLCPDVPCHGHAQRGASLGSECAACAECSTWPRCPPTPEWPPRRHSTLAHHSEHRNDDSCANSVQGRLLSVSKRSLRMQTPYPFQSRNSKACTRSHTVR
mmetsp:Transcript_50620/g.134792  ORF Transcript_50620/g.134792 Transcript_50620/m.134792 type:complete len:206 (-) Transcript_50620:795-1412(-)